MAAKAASVAGFVRIGTGSPEIEVADPMFNAKSIVRMMKKAQQKKVNILLLPELIVTGYTCGDLFFRNRRVARLNALEPIRMATKTVYKGVVAVGCPVELDGDLYNCAVLMQGGKVSGRGAEELPAHVR